MSNRVLSALSQDDRDALGGHICMSGKPAVLEALQSVMREGNTAGVIRVHLRNMGSINDTFGHHFGNQLLLEIFRYLLSISGFGVFRYSGVEFIIILDSTPQVETARLAKEILNRFYQPWYIGGGDCVCTLSIGYSCYPGQAGLPEEMMDNLAYAVTQAGKEERSSIVYCDESPANRTLRRLEIIHSLASAVKNNLFYVRYRPTLHIPSGRYRRVDCIFGLTTPHYNTIHASDFIPVARGAGHLRAFDRYAVRTACGAIERLITAGIDFESVSLPVSTDYFLCDSFPEEIADMLNEMLIPPKLFSLGFSQDVLLADFRRVQQKMYDLSSIGIELALRDFGAAGTDVQKLVSLPLSVLKLERSLIWQMEYDKRTAVTVESLIQAIKDMGLKLVAEGVETQRQADMLKQYGCEYEQGVFYTSLLTLEELKLALGRPLKEAAYDDGSCMAFY